MENESKRVPQNAEDAAQQARRIETVLNVAAQNASRNNVNALKLYTDANYHLAKADRFQGEGELLSLVFELIGEGKLRLARSGTRAEEIWVGCV